MQRHDITLNVRGKYKIYVDTQRCALYTERYSSTLKLNIIYEKRLI